MPKMQISQMNLFQLQYDNASDKFSSGFSLFTLVLASLLPVLIFLLLFKLKSKLQTISVINRIGSLYEGLRIDSSSALLFNSFFVLRRLMFAFLCVFSTDFSNFQIQGLSFQCILISIYLGREKPFVLSLSNKIEIFNELTILSISYHLFLLTDFMPDLDMQYQVGYSLIAFTTLNIVVNMAVILVLGGRSLVKKIQFIRKNWSVIKARIKATLTCSKGETYREGELVTKVQFLQPSQGIEKGDQKQQSLRGEEEDLNESSLKIKVKTKKRNRIQLDAFEFAFQTQLQNQSRDQTVNYINHISDEPFQFSRNMQIKIKQFLPQLKEVRIDQVKRNALGQNDLVSAPHKLDQIKEEEKASSIKELRQFKTQQKHNQSSKRNEKFNNNQNLSEY